ncbi:hypothetical protein TI39_contig5882g00006 [Zymoseptoria brevis]|uniref:Ribosomal protein bL31m N-terminal domain-containing protein n=1 Tax=Zymoseptoria brevis TaxID=1047168 RepID=A0A0F4G7M5_9PEZI|nr:hypothetical protein TI39_contig5882g00006 [Zymoseptoria brevis]
MLFNSGRPTLCTRCLQSSQQIRHASLIRRPKRPYTFTQLITLSDGSTFTHRTTSPQPVYRSAKDTKNSLLWNPSSAKLQNVEEDEAGRLRNFRKRFGRGFDAEAVEAEEGDEKVDGSSAVKEESLMDMITAMPKQQEPKKGKAAAAAAAPEPAAKSGKPKGGKK